MLELPKGFAVAQVKSIKRPQPIPFENVKDKVTRDFRADQAKELAQKRASEILAQAKEKGASPMSPKPGISTSGRVNSFRGRTPIKT